MDDTSCLTENSPSRSNGLMFFITWMTNPFERADVFDEWMTKAIQMDANFSEQLTNRL